jgi:hypothetical protein
MEKNDKANLSEPNRESLMIELATRNQSRYEEQAREFLQEGGLLVEIDGKLLEYRFEDPFCMAYLSSDGGESFERLGGRRLDPSEGSDEFRVFWEFADKEARVLLHY